MNRISCIVESPVLRVELEAAAAALGSEYQFSFHSDLSAGLASLRYEPVDVVAVELPADASRVLQWSQLIDSMRSTTALIGILSEEAEQADGVVVEAVRLGLRDFLRRPASAGELTGILSRLDKPQQMQAREGKLVTIASTKGGVGKSTISTNLAVSFAKKYPGQVLLIDGSLQLGVIASLLDLQPTTTLTTIAASIDRLDPVLLREMALSHESGLDVLPAPVLPTEAGDVDDAVMTVLLGVAKKSYDYVFVDTFPLINAMMLSVFDRCDQIIVVTENVVPTLSGTAAMLQVFEQLEIPRDRWMVVLNRYRRLAGSLSKTEVSNQLGVPIDIVVPFDRKLIEAANLGKPLILRSAMRRSVRSIKKLSSRVQTLLQGSNKSSAQQPVGRPSDGSSRRVASGSLVANDPKTENLVP